jgi:NodT family efflux transporter outer membrane factor (OMF) lipoprotein
MKRSAVGLPPGDVPTSRVRVTKVSCGAFLQKSDRLSEITRLHPIALKYVNTSRALALMMPLAIALCGCMVGPDFKLPGTPTPPTYRAKGDAPAPVDEQIMLGAKSDRDWWALFHSHALDDTMQLAIAGNQDIVAAKAQVAEAREAMKATAGALYPQISLSGTAGNQKYGKSVLGSSVSSLPSFTYYSIGPSVDFPLDLFGGERRTVEEKAAYVDYQRYELEAVYLTVTANVAEQALAVAAAQAQIAATQAIIADDRRTIAMVQTMLGAGSATATQLLTAQSALASDLTLLPPLQQQLSAARHALAILVGKSPAEWTPPDFILDDFTLPGEIPASLPSELVHRRPDIRAAESQLHIASAAIGVATANLYPNIDLSGTLTQQALTPGLLFNSVATAWSLAASISQPVFEGGRLSAERREAIDGYNVALANYRQAILTAFGDVSNQMQALANDANEAHAEGQAASTANAAFDAARRSYAGGNSGILDVIDAERQLAQARLGMAQAEARRLNDTVQLCLALGGNSI